MIVAGLVAATAVGVGAALMGPSPDEADAAPAIVLPPAGASFDYQIGGAYDPPSGVKIVSRDVKAAPAKGLYNICYVNAFQTQQEGDVGGPEDWDGRLLLTDSDGEVVIDPDWDEAILDISTDTNRKRIAAEINSQIDTCAEKGFDAVELDNFDTFGRDVVDGRITAGHAQSYIRLLSEHGHAKGLAVAQKNTVELADNHKANGLDFVIAEECGNPEWNECGDYVSAFGDNAIFIEYDSAGMKNACAYSDRVSVVRRDVGVSKPSSGTYVRKLCTS